MASVKLYVKQTSGELLRVGEARLTAILSQKADIPSAWVIDGKLYYAEVHFVGGEVQEISTHRRQVDGLRVAERWSPAVMHDTLGLEPPDVASAEQFFQRRRSADRWQLSNSQRLFLEKDAKGPARRR